MKKEAALHPPVKLTPEEEEAAKEMIRKVIAEVTDQLSDSDIKDYSIIQDQFQ